MPIGLADLLRIRQELGFYAAGGGRRSEGEQIGSALSGLGSGLNSAAQGIGSGFDTFGKAMAIRKAQAEQRPVGSYFGVPSPEDEASLRQLFAQKQATRVPENIFPQQPLPEGAQGPMPSSVPQPAQQLTPPPDIRGQFQQKYGISPDVPSFMVPEITKMVAAGKSPEVLPVNALPQDARARALAAGFQEDGMIDLKKFNALKTTDPYAPVSTYKPQGALDAETIPGNAKVIVPPKEEELPTYKKSYLLSLSNDDLRALGKYKVLDDIAASKSTEENQILDSILSGIDKLSGVRAKMGGFTRSATLVPGGAAIAKLGSAPLTEWETEKNLLAQRLGKLVEKNRMSDEDRQFYLRMFNSPASTDAAFTANIDALKGAVGLMKKEIPGSLTESQPQTETTSSPSVQVNHNEALNWARKHPLDPRAKPILERAQKATEEQ